jgi:hypothetical protein
MHFSCKKGHQAMCPAVFYSALSKHELSNSSAPQTIAMQVLHLSGLRLTNSAHLRRQMPMISVSPTFRAQRECTLALGLVFVCHHDSVQLTAREQFSAMVCNLFEYFNADAPIRYNPCMLSVIIWSLTTTSSYEPTAWYHCRIPTRLPYLQRKHHLLNRFG